MMMNRLWLCILMLMHIHIASAQQFTDSTAVSIADKSSVEANVYWTKNYYDTIPKQQVLTKPLHQDFDQVVSKYQNSDFEYVESISDKLSFIQKIKKRLAEFIMDLFPSSNAHFNEIFFYFLAILGGLLLVYVLYKYFFSGNKIFLKTPKEKDEEKEQELAFVESNLMEVDLNNYINTALQEANYALAIRYQQLLNIQLLQQKGIIKWDRSKTNYELMEQLTNAELKNSFKLCTQIFDYVWFGDFNATEDTYKEYRVVFENFRRKWA